MTENIMRDRDPNSHVKRLEYVRALNSRIARLPRTTVARVNECKQIIWESYEAATITPQIALASEEPNMEAAEFRSIGLRGLVKEQEFSDPTYYWGPYFSDVGRAVAAGEQKYLQECIPQQIKPDTETISFSHPDYLLVTDSISHLRSKNLDPDTLLAPIDLFVSFVKYFYSLIDWEVCPEVLRIGNAALKLIWSHRYAPLDNFIIFSSRAGVWQVKPDVDTQRSLTIALGESEAQIGHIEYWVETLVRYSITEPSAFKIIGVSGRPLDTQS